jgi:hypothetical protein
MITSSSFHAFRDHKSDISPRETTGTREKLSVAGQAATACARYVWIMGSGGCRVEVAAGCGGERVAAVGSGWLRWGAGGCGGWRLVGGGSEWLRSSWSGPYPVRTWRSCLEFRPWLSQRARLCRPPGLNNLSAPATSMCLEKHLALLWRWSSRARIEMNLNSSTELAHRCSAETLSTDIGLPVFRRVPISSHQIDAFTSPFLAVNLRAG